jgi:nucleoside-diphosphate-sugar epimerase
MQIAVTGGFGRLGRYVVRHLQRYAAVEVIDVAKAPVDLVELQRPGNILDLDSLVAAFRGKDAVIHIAAADGSWNVPASVTFNINVQGSWNVLEAARVNRVPKVIVCSSTSAVGFIRSNFPSYLPIDESHPGMPTGTYGLSKRLVEELAENLARSEKMDIVCIRPVYIVFPEILNYIKTRVGTDHEYGTGKPGTPDFSESLPVSRSYVRPHDLAVAFSLALQFEGPRFSKFQIAASDSYSSEPVLEYVQRIYGRLPELRKPGLYSQNPFASLFDSDAARVNLRWQSTGSWRDLLDGNSLN